MHNYLLLTFTHLVAFGLGIAARELYRSLTGPHGRSQ